jgi:hypothetical protein
MLMLNEGMAIFSAFPIGYVSAVALALPLEVM